MRVLISGASIAGPTLAYWLERYGFDVTVVELAPALRSGGYAVDFRGGVQLAVLDRMGLLDQVRAHQTGGHPGRFVDETDATVLSLPCEFTGGNLEIQRADLSRLLYDHSRERVEYRFGDSIAALNQTPAGVDVTFDHAPSERFDLVIGADGLHSRVRRLAFGPEDDYVRHLGYYIAGWDLPNIWELDGEQRFHNRPGTLAGVSEQMHRPDRANTTFIFAAPVDPELRGNRDRQGDLLRRVYAGQGWYVPQLVAAFPSATDVYFDSVSRVEVPRWSTGRIALLGDAASGATLSGTGTGTAIVGAYALAGELASGVAITSKPSSATSSSYGRTPFGTRTVATPSPDSLLPAVEPRCGFAIGYSEAGWAAGSFCASPSRRTASMLPEYSRPVPPSSYQRTDSTWGKL